MDARDNYPVSREDYQRHLYGIDVAEGGNYFDEDHSTPNQLCATGYPDWCGRCSVAEKCGRYNEKAQ